MELIVCGSRTWFDVPTINAVAHQLIDKYGTDLVIKHGGAGGADSIAHAAFVSFGVKSCVFLADWSHGKSAGMVRNMEMLRSGCDGVVAFWDGQSPGTAHMLSLAEDAAIKTWVIRPGHFGRIPHP